MYKQRKIAVVMPAYNAEKTLRTAYDEVVAQGVADVVIIVDDCSRDATQQVAESLVSRASCLVPSTPHEALGTRHEAQSTPHNAQGTRHEAQGTKHEAQSTKHEAQGIPHEAQGTPHEAPSTKHEAQGTTTLYHRHVKNRGYGGNQKTCYELALAQGADIVVMVHPDCQYTPKLLVPMVAMIAEGLHPCVLASRILGGYALKGGMPWWKYVSNRFLTATMNLLFGSKLSEFHTGYRAFSAELIRRLPLDRNSDDFVFDAQMLAEILHTGATIGEVSCPTVYTPEASSINFRRSCTYGLGCLATALAYRLARLGLPARLFRP